MPEVIHMCYLQSPGLCFIGLTNKGQKSPLRKEMLCKGRALAHVLLKTLQVCGVEGQKFLWTSVTGRLNLQMQRFAGDQSLQIRRSLKNLHLETSVCGQMHQPFPNRCCLGSTPTHPGVHRARAHVIVWGVIREGQIAMAEA